MSDSQFTPGRTLGRYELLLPIAEGGMASVWAARMKGQRGFQKIVAIKQMKPELTDDPNFETMFLDEASLVSRLRHPNLAEILDLGEEDDVLFQVMEFVDGEPLNRLLRQSRGGVPVPLAVRIVKEACAGLHMAHELRDEEGNLVNLVHRDVSLQNILVTLDGVTKVIDFGVAKAMSNLQKTSVGQVKGKVPYMSPEQAVGEQVDRRTDVFALGIVLYQLITGKHPFRGDTDLETIMRICDKEPVKPPSTVAKGIPPELDALVAKALAKDRKDRFPTMNEMLRALEVVLPPDLQASAEDLGRFMQKFLGERLEKRRLAIQEAGRSLDLAAGGPKSIPPPTSGRGRMGTIPPSARMNTLSDHSSATVPDFPGVGRSPSLAAPRLPSAGSLGLEGVATPPGANPIHALATPPSATPVHTPTPPTARSMGLPPPLPNSGRPMSVPPPPQSAPPEHRPNRTVPPPPLSGPRPSGAPLTSTQPSLRPPPVPAVQPSGGGALRTLIFAVLAAGFGLVIGYAALTLTGDQMAQGTVPLAVPALTKIRMRVKLTIPTAAPPSAPAVPSSPSAAPTGSAAPGK